MSDEAILEDVSVLEKSISMLRRRRDEFLRQKASVAEHNKFFRERNLSQT